MEEIKEWTVYVHISPSNKYYVGITCQEPERRWKKNGRGYFYQNNEHFENAIKKYGWDNFQHEIIASHLTEAEAKNFEKILIQKLNSRNPNFGYNKTDGGDGFAGVKRYGKNNSFYGKHHTEKTKKIIQKALGKPICQFDLDLNFIKEYPSIKNASKINNFNCSMLEGCANHKTGYRTAYNYVWILKEELPFINLLEYKKALKHEKLPKQINQFDLEYNFIKKFNSIGEASRKTSIDSSSISHALSYHYKQAGGFIWITEEELTSLGLIAIKEKRKNLFPEKELKKVYKFDLNKNLIYVYNSRTEAAKAMGISPQAIGNACRSKTHQSQGFLWSYEEKIEKV